MVDLTFTPHIEILSAEDVPRRRHWSDADKIRLVEESHRGHRQVSATAGALRNTMRHEPLAKPPLLLSSVPSLTLPTCFP
jgi:hypothetical protein